MFWTEAFSYISSQQTSLDLIVSGGGQQEVAVFSELFPFPLSPFCLISVPRCELLKHVLVCWERVGVEMGT